MFHTFLVVLLILILAGVLPVWKHSKDWGKAPAGGIVLVIVLIIILSGGL